MRKPSRTVASFQLPGLACFGGALRSLILPVDCGRGVTDFLVEATLMVASSSADIEAWLARKKLTQSKLSKAGAGAGAGRNASRAAIPLRESIEAMVE